jgi:hypothetical protein
MILARSQITSRVTRYSKRNHTPIQLPVCRRSTQDVVRYNRLRFWAASIELRALPSFLYEEGQVMDPVIFANAAWIDNVTQVVSRIRDNKICVGN